MVQTVQWGGGKGQFALAELLQIRAGSFTPQCNFFNRFVSLYSLISSLFCFTLKLLTNAHYILRDYCTAAGYRALNVVLFDLKPLTKMATGRYVRTAWKGASEALRTHFRACKIAKFPEGMALDPPQAIYSIGPTFCICLGPPPHNCLGSPGCKGVVPTLFGWFHPFMCLFSLS